MKSKVRIAALLTLLGVGGLAQASCGGAFCTVNTGSEAHGDWAGPGTRLDLHYEFVDQRQLRSGTRKVSPAGEIGGEPDELSTVNRILKLTVDHSFDDRWGMTVQLPYVRRSHLHINNSDFPGPTAESWSIGGVGDTRVVGRYQLWRDDTGKAAGLRFGLKLPTGRTTVINADGARAERTLQPGTGTTDAVLGAYWRDALGSGDWFASLNWQRALDQHEDFRPGSAFSADLGISRPLGGIWSGQVQLNAVWRGRDSGAQAEPSLSGGHSLFLSPGVSAAIDQHTTLYGYLQLPLRQYVNGTQLTAKWGAIIGFSRMF